MWVQWYKRGIILAEGAESHSQILGNGAFKVGDFLRYKWALLWFFLSVLEPGKRSCSECLSEVNPLPWSCSFHTTKDKKKSLHGNLIKVSMQKQTKKNLLFGTIGIKDQTKYIYGLDFLLKSLQESLQVFIDF